MTLSLSEERENFVALRVVTCLEGEIVQTVKDLEAV